MIKVYEYFNSIALLKFTIDNLTNFTNLPKNDK